MRRNRSRLGYGAAFGAGLTLLGAPAQAEFLFESKGTQPGDITTEPFKSPTADCKVCHRFTDPDATETYTPFPTWAGTMMANSLRDPLYLAAVSVAESDEPAKAAGEVGLGQWCVRCHSPVAYLSGNTSPLDDTKWTEAELQGVGCDVCHRSTIEPAFTGGDAEAPHVGNAQIYFDPGQAFRGPYPDVANSRHEGKLDPFTSSSELCGQCHQVSNPLATLLDEGGVDTGLPFPLDTTYDEWKDSVFSVEGAEKKGCIDCHMPRVEGQFSVAAGPVVVNPPKRANPAMHLFVGGNRWGIDAVAHANPSYANANKESFDLARAAAEAMLRASAKLEPIGLPSGQVAAGATVDFGVRVINLSGHKFPTGYADGRRAFLQVGFVDRTGREVVLSGRYENDDLVVEGDPSLRVYEALHASSKGAAAEGHLARYDRVVKDSRIPPKGFKGSDTTRPVGVNWYDPADGEAYRHEDAATYSMTLPSAFTDGPGKAFVRLVFQATTKHYVELLEQANAGKNQRGQKLRETWEATGKAAPFVVAQLEADVTLTGGTLPPPGAGGAGGAAGTGGGAGAGSGAGGQAAAAGASPASPDDADSEGCSCTLGPRDRDSRAALVAAGLVALALGALRRRRG
jgi:cytochrome c554/c'-like protein